MDLLKQDKYYNILYYFVKKVYVKPLVMFKILWRVVRRLMLIIFVHDNQRCSQKKKDNIEA